MRIDNTNGRVGIGTTSPSQKLTVEDIIGIKRSGVAAITTLQQTGTGLILNAPSGYHPFVVKYNGAEHARFTNTGRVGIGTTSPGRKLTVTGDASGDANNLLLVNENDTDGDSASIGFSMLSNNTYVKAGIFFKRNTTQGRGDLIFATNNEVNGNNVGVTNEIMSIRNTGAIEIKGTSTTLNGKAFITNTDALTMIGSTQSSGVPKDMAFFNGAERIRIKATSGNVGIGDDDPDAKLTVNSTATPQLLLTNTGGGNSQILMYDNSGGTQNASITFDQTGDNQLYITTGYDSPNDLNRIYLQPGGETAMTLVGGDNTTGKAGNVGIGTDIPSQKLSIATNALTSNPEYIEFQDFGSGSSWAIGMDFGGIQWHTGDGTGIGAHLIAQIKAQNERNGAAAAGALVFSTAPYNTVMSERMRIKSDGNILIADTRKIEFYNTSQYIYANSTNDLTLASGDDINFQSNYIRFFNAGVEGSRISATTASWVANGSNGTLGVNRVPSGSYNLEILGSTYSSGSIRSGSWFQGTSATNTLYSSTALGTYLQSPGNSGTAGTIYFRNGSGTVSANIFSGTITAAGDVIAYGSPSDKRLKENIKPIKSALDKVSKLQGVTFDWKEKGITNLKEDIGFIAQDVQKVIPELVRENEDGMLSMRHQGIAPILLEAIKELKAEIEELKLNKCNCKCSK
jgi:hypothetical protein